MERKQLAVKPIIDKDTLIATRSNLKTCADRKLVNGDLLGPRVFRFYRVTCIIFQTFLLTTHQCRLVKNEIRDNCL